MVRVRISSNQQRMNSSMAEQSPVKRQDESSSLSSSAVPFSAYGESKVEVSAPTTVSWACLSRRWRDHSHMERNPVGRVPLCGIENRLFANRGSRVRISFSPHKIGRVDREVMYRFAKRRLSVKRYKGSIPLLSAFNHRSFSEGGGLCERVNSIACLPVGR